MQKESSNFTFELVKSMGKREKIYFRRYANLSTQQDKSYLKLYDFFLKERSFNREKLMEHFKDEPFIQHLSSKLLYLEDQLLNSLVNYHFLSRKGTQLSKLIAHVSTLMVKGFSKKGARLIKKAKKEAYAREEFALILRLTELEEEILFNHGILKFTTELERLQEERRHIIDLMMNYTEIRLMKEKFREIVYCDEIILSPEQLGNYPDLSSQLMKSESSALSNKAKVYWHYNAGLLGCITRDYKKALYHFKEELKLLHEYPKKFPKILLPQCLSNIMYLSSFVLDKEAFDSAHEELDQLFAEGKVENGYYHYIKFCRSFSYAVRDDDPVQLAYLLEGSYPFIEQEPGPLNVLESGILLELMIQACILLEDFSQGARLIHIWNTRCNLSTQYRIIKPLALIIYFELGYKELLESTLRSAERINLGPSMNSELERSLLHFFEHSLKAPDPNKVIRKAKQLKSDIARISGDINENVLFSLFDFNKWAKDLPARLSKVNQ